MTFSDGQEGEEVIKGQLYICCPCCPPVCILVNDHNAPCPIHDVRPTETWKKDK